MMNIEWMSLLTGLFFGLIPARALLNSDCRFLEFEELRGLILNNDVERRRRRRRWWKLPLVWIDPVRGYVVATLLNGAIAPAERATTPDRVLPMAVTCGLFVLVALMQTLGRPAKREALCPALFMGGCIVGLLPPFVAVSALVVGVATAWAVVSYAIGYAAVVAVVAAMGVLFIPSKLELIEGVTAVAAPLVIFWWRHARWVVPVRC